MRSMREITLVVAILAVMAVTSEARDKKPGKTGPGQAASEIANSATNDPEYIIGPADVLSVNVWKEPELSVSVPVRPDGKISLPLLNDVQAAGLTPMRLTNLLAGKFKQFVADPRVAVTVTETNSRRIYILGEVARPGAFPLLPRMTVLQALSSAGGFGQYADRKNIYVLRSENGQQTKLPFNYKEVIKGKRAEQNIILQPGDTIVVP
jgi:polysaccharide biosynthesis/export protein